MKNNYISKKVSDIKLSFIILVLFGIIPIIGLAQTVTFSTSNPATPASTIVIGATKQIIYRAVISLSGFNGSGSSLTSVTFTPTGTFTTADISNYQFYWNTTDNIATATQNAANAIVLAPNNQVTISPYNPWFSDATTYYVWITADINASATLGRTISVGALTTSNFNFTGTKTGTMSIGGVQTKGASTGGANRYSVASGNWSSPSTWAATSSGAGGASVPISGDNVYIQGNKTVTLNQHTGNLTNLSIALGSQLTTTSNKGVSAITIDLNGYYLNGSSEAVTGTINVGAGATYEHNINGGVIPDATWNATSLLKITGITTTIAKLPNPIAGNVEWNCPNQTVSGEILDNETYSIGGNLSLTNTGAGSVYLWNQNGTGYSLNIGGNYSQASGNLVVDKMGDTDIHTINIYGNWNMSGGTFDCSGNTANVANINIAGNYTQTGGTLTETSTGSGSITFTGNGTQIYSKTGGTISNTINFAVPTSRIVDLGTSVIQGAGTFTLSSGGNIITANADGLTTSGAKGSIQVTGTRTYNAMANYTFNGANQTIGNGVAAANNLILAGSGTKTFSVTTAISNTLTINTSIIANLGTITTHTANTLNLGGDFKTTGKWGGNNSAATNKNETYFKNATGIVTISDSPCAFASNTSRNSTWTPTVGIPREEQIANDFKLGQYINVDVIQGLVYQLYTSGASQVNGNTGNGTGQLKIAVYNENGGALIASSSSNTSNPKNTDSYNVFLSFTSPISGQIRVLINAKDFCSNTSYTALTLYSNVTGGENTLDSRIAYGATDTWIGHVYDGIDFNNYIGYYSPAPMTTTPASTDQFQELFNVPTGSFNNAGTCNDISFGVKSNSVIRAKVLDEYFSVRYRMNSTRKGFWKVSLGSDDGDRLYIDNKLYYDWWEVHAPAYQDNILISLTGKSTLLLEYYQGPYKQCQIGFYNLTLIYANNLTAYNTTVCRLQPATQITGQAQPTGLQAGFTFKNFQWYYSTTPTGTRIPITGATSANFTPITTAAPFNASGTYYIYRNCTITSTTNVSAKGAIPASFDVTHESDPAILRVNSCINYWTGKESDQWTNNNSWTLGVPYTGADVEFATTDNHANDPNGTVRDLNTIVDANYVLGSLKNETPDKALIVNRGSSITVSDDVITNNPDRILIKADETYTKANGSLIFPNARNVQGSVEMWSKANITNQDYPNKYNWQYFGIPVETMVADPVLYNAYVRRADEAGTNEDANYYWKELGTYDNLTKFLGYEICQAAPTKYTFTGQLVNTDFDSKLLPISNNGKTDVETKVKYPGQHLFANPYTAAINIDKIEFGSDMDKTIYLYNTGSYGQWDNTAIKTSSGNAPGQYFSIPYNIAGSNGVTSQIPSMSSFLVKTGLNNGTGSYIKMKYSDVAVKNSTLQKVKAAEGVSNSDLVSTRIDLNGLHYNDQMWIFTEPTCTKNFDNGWDGRKILGSTLAPQIYAIEPDGDYQVNSVSDMHDTDLAFQAGDELEYTLKFTHENIQRVYAGVYLVDLLENNTVDISQSGTTYTFATAQTEEPTKRFKIITRRYEKDAPDQESSVRIFSSNGTVYIHNLSNSNGESILYDIAGRMIKKINYGPNAVTEAFSGLKTGAFVVSAITNGEKVSKRIIVQ